jgi:hypothetical protein
MKIMSKNSKVFKSTSLLILLCLISLKCNNDKSRNDKPYCTFQATDEKIIIKIGEKEVNRTFRNQFFSANDSNYLAVLNEEQNDISIYNLDQKKLFRKIKIEKEGSNSFIGLTSFIIKNLDTIIYISPTQWKVAVADGLGKILKNIPVNSENNFDRCIDLSILSQRPILIGNTLYLQQNLFFFMKNRKDFSSGELEKSSVGITINLDNDEVKSIPLNYPVDLVGKDLTQSYVNWDLGYQNNFIYNFSLLGNIYVTKDFSEFQRITIETDYKMKLGENKSRFGSIPELINYAMQVDNLNDIQYDKYRECYYLFVRKRTDNLKQNQSIFIDYPNCLVIILDKDFKHLGDFDFPENTYSFNNTFITEKGLYISEDHVNNPAYSEDAMTFRLFELKKNENK